MDWPLDKTGYYYGHAFKKSWRDYDPLYLEVVRDCMINDPGFGETTPLMETALLGSEHELDQHLKRPANCLATNFLGQTALHLAILRPKLLRMLIPHYEHMEIRDRSGYTPLVYALAYKQPESVLLLLEATKCCAIRPTLSDTRTFLRLCVCQDEQALLYLVLKHCKKIHEADKFQELLNEFMEDYAGYFLHHLRNDDNHLQHLLNFGADPNLTIGRDPGQTLLHFVTNISQVKALFEAGFTHDINHADSEGRTVLMRAIGSRNTALIEEYLEMGASLDQRDKQGWSVMHYAAKELKDIVGYVCRCEACRVRRLAQCSEMVDIVKLLLHWGADPVTRDYCLCACSHSGCSPSTILLQHGNPYRGPYRGPYLPAGQEAWWLEWLKLLSEAKLEFCREKALIDLMRTKRFDDHDLTHVCCRGHKDRRLCVQEDDVHEVLDEEKEAINVFEDDMNQFLAHQQEEGLEENLVEQIVQSFRRYLDNQKQKWTDYPGVKAHPPALIDSTEYEVLKYQTDPSRVLFIDRPRDEIKLEFDLTINTQDIGTEDYRTWLDYYPGYSANCSMPIHVDGKWCHESKAHAFRLENRLRETLTEELSGCDSTYVYY
ncbi:MAG: hypothetical protein M1821_005585 [Bathelium mastoideum]|nr:MAG: hypothetical protein M1821_005585 [Bathelium mastoideum]